MAVTENDLLARAAQGDGDALTELLERHTTQVRQALAGKIPQRWQAVVSEDDVLQETYIDAFLDIRRFTPRGEGSFVAWLVTLANRNLIDALRMLEAERRGGDRRRVEAASSGDSLVALYELVGATTSTPSRIAARGEASAALKSAIEQLSDTARRVIEMYDLECRPVGEVAEALGRSQGAIFMLRARAHRRLQEVLGAASKFLSG